MKKNPTILLASLTVLAIILGGMLLVIPSKPAQAVGMINSTPAVTMISASRYDNLYDYVIIIDKSSDKLLIYSMNQNKELSLVAAQDYSRVFNDTPTVPGRTPHY